MNNLRLRYGFEHFAEIERAEEGRCSFHLLLGDELHDTKS